MGIGIERCCAAFSQAMLVKAKKKSIGLIAKKAPFLAVAYLVFRTLQVIFRECWMRGRESTSAGVSEISRWLFIREITDVSV